MKPFFLAIVLLWVVIYVLPLGVRPLFIPDETRYAEVPREMLATGEWIVPHLNGVTYFEKPPLGYWVTAASISLFGANPFAVRFPAALATILTALAVFLLVRRHGGGQRTGLAAGAIYLTTVLVAAIGVFAVLDAPFTMWTTLCVVSAFCAIAETDNRARRREFWCMAGFFCGLGFLVKGFLAVVVPSLVLVPYLLWERRFTAVIREVWIPMAVALATILPWALAIHLRDGDFWRYFVWTEHLQRFVSAGGRQQHQRPFWFFLPVLIGGLVPWVFMAGAAASGVRKFGLGRPIVRLCICWVVFPFLFFSASSGKLATYILPCFAPIVILTAIGLCEYLDRGRQTAFRWGAAVSALFATGVWVALVLGQKTALVPYRPYTAGEEAKWVMAAVALGVWVLLSVCSCLASRANARFILCAGAPVMLLVCANFLVPVGVMMDRVIPAGLMAAHEGSIGKDDIVIADADEAPALCWALRRSDLYVLGDGGELKYGLLRDGGPDRLVPFHLLREFVSTHGSNRSVVVVEEEGDYERWRDTIPPPSHQDAKDGFVFIEQALRPRDAAGGEK